jgi:hypothetical protein
MSQFVHIVYVHPVENGEPNLHKIKNEIEFGTIEEATSWIKWYNYSYGSEGEYRAVYYGCVNDETGELV